MYERHNLCLAVQGIKDRPGKAQGAASGLSWLKGLFGKYFTIYAHEP